MGNGGENLGVVSIEEALRLAEEAGLDLIEIAPTAKPPVCRIMEYGKYLYMQEKKARESAKKSHTSELRQIQVSLGISQHDLELKAQKASEFLKDGDRVRIELVLKGRAKYMDKNFINERLQRILHLITEKHKIMESPKKGPRGISILIEKEK